MLIQWQGVHYEFDDNMLFSFYCRVLIVVVKKYVVDVKVPADGTVKPEYRKVKFPPSIHPILNILRAQHQQCLQNYAPQFARAYSLLQGRIAVAM